MSTVAQLVLATPIDCLRVLRALSVTVVAGGIAHVVFESALVLDQSWTNVLDEIEAIQGSKIARVLVSSADGLDSAVNEFASAESKATMVFLTGNALIQNDVLSALLKVETFAKHVMSLDVFLDIALMTVLRSRMALHRRTLKESKADLPQPMWCVLEPSRWETVGNKVRSVLPALGVVYSVHVAASAFPSDIDPDQAGAAEMYGRLVNSLPLSCLKGMDPESLRVRELAAILGVMRKIFGRIAGMTSSPPAADGGQVFIIRFASNDDTVKPLGAVYLLPIDSGSPPDFTMTVTGKNGRIVIQFNHKLRHFECDRQLGHFEHPAQLPSTGIEWSLASFKDFCAMADRSPELDISGLPENRGSSGEWFLDLSMAQTSLTSPNVPVRFALVPAKSA